MCENIEIIDLMTLSAQQAFGFACPAFLPQKATVAQIESHGIACHTSTVPTARSCLNCPNSAALRSPEPSASSSSNSFAASLPCFLSSAPYLIGAVNHNSTARSPVSACRPMRCTSTDLIVV